MTTLETFLLIVCGFLLYALIVCIFFMMRLASETVVTCRVNLTPCEGDDPTTPNSALSTPDGVPCQRDNGSVI